MLTVEDVGTSIRVRQNRFWERGHLDAKCDTVIWFSFLIGCLSLSHAHYRKIPLAVKIKNGYGVDFEHSQILAERETTLKVDSSMPFKLNAGTTGVCKFSCFSSEPVAITLCMQTVYFTPKTYFNGLSKKPSTPMASSPQRTVSAYSSIHSHLRKRD
jgi:hypothetical protein